MENNKEFIKILDNGMKICKICAQEHFIPKNKELCLVCLIKTKTNNEQEEINADKLF